MAIKTNKNQVSGLLLLNKPVGISSNGILQRVKRLFAAGKAGHIGTLDPLASGLLPICFGEATKFAAQLSDAVKGYRATVALGQTTSTGDAEGVVLTRQPVDVEPAKLREIVHSLVGTRLQIPPMHSACKHEGKPLYEYARKGQNIPRPAREIVIHEVEILALHQNELDIHIRCSKGTYIRTLAEEIGMASGCGAYLKVLQRTHVAHFDLLQAYTMEQLDAMALEQRINVLLPLDEMLPDMPNLVLSDDCVTRLSQGQTVIELTQLRGPIKLYDQSKRFFGIGMVSADNQLSPYRLLATN